MVKFLPLRQVQSFSLRLSLFSLVSILTIKAQTATRSTTWLKCACRTFYAFFIEEISFHSVISIFFSVFLVSLNPLVSCISCWCLSSSPHPPPLHRPVSPPLSKATCTFTFFLTCHCDIRILGFERQLAAFSSA